MNLNMNHKGNLKHILKHMIANREYIRFWFWFLTEATTKSRPAPNKEVLPIANADTEFYCSGNIMAVPN